MSLQISYSSLSSTRIALNTSKNMYVQVPHIALLLLVLMAWLSLYQASDHPAVVLLYEKKTESYTSVDLETIDQYRLLRDGKNRKVTTCPALDEKTGKILHDVLELSTDQMESNDQKETHNPRCKNSYTPSMVDNERGSGYTVGLYFIENKSIFENKNLPLFSKVFGSPHYEKPRMQIYEIEFNPVTFKVTKTRHRIFSHRRFLYDIPKPCEQLTGMVQVEGGLTADIKSYYSPVKQQRQFESEQIMGRDNEILVPVQLVPIDDFTDNASRQATCTYFNTVPIWQSVAEVIRQMETFIRSLADVIDVGALEVETRTFDIVVLRSWMKDDREFYLDFDHKKIRVPRFFMKIIHYRVASPITNHDDPNKYDYYMIIGVYNSKIGGTEQNTLRFGCNYDICLKYHWNISISFDQKFKMFCCEIGDTSSLKQLGLNKISGNNLDLNQIPVGTDEKGEIKDWLQLAIFR